MAPANFSSLLQNVLGIMNTIKHSRAAVEEEEAVLQELMELVVIMQEEAEMLIKVSGLVEEYCGEVDVELEVREMEQWCFELGFDQGEIEEDKKPGHEREDSGVGLDDEGMLGERSEGAIDLVDDRGLEEMNSRLGDSLIGILHG